MIKLSYYVIDVGENYYVIKKKKEKISIREALKEQNNVFLKILLNKIQSDCIPFGISSFKVVAVNKEEKLFVESEVEDSTTKEKIEPVAQFEDCDIYIMYPNQTLTVRCSVYPREIEIRTLPYSAIKEANPKRHRK